MYGDEGWCRGCGTPLGGQTGAIVIQGNKFPTAEVWMPNWLFDVVCVSARVASDITERFNVGLGDVLKPRGGLTGAKQLLPAQTVERWYRQDELARAVRARHSEHDGERTGSSCGRCGRWKWLPVTEGESPIAASAFASAFDVISSPEVFGDGLMSFRHLLFRRPLGEALVAASPRNWDLTEVEVG